MAEENIRKLKYENKCSVPGCKTVKENENINIMLFSVPKRVRCTEILRSHWLNLFKLERLNMFPSIFNICEKHFEESDIVKPLEDQSATLLPKAVPVHFLPEDSTPEEDFDLYDEGASGDSSSDDYPQSRESLEKEPVPVTLPIITMEEQIEEEFHDAIEKVVETKKVEEKEENQNTIEEQADPSGMDETPEEEEKVYHDLKPHITGEEILPNEEERSFSPKITNIEAESSKLNETVSVVSEEKVLKVIKRVAPARNPVQEDEEESPTKRPRRNVIHKLIKPRVLKELSSESPLKSTPVKKLSPKPIQVIVKKDIKITPIKVIKKVEKTTPLKLAKISPKVEKVKVSPKVVAKPTVSPKITLVPHKAVAKSVAVAKNIVVKKPPTKSDTKVDKKEPEPESNGAAASRSRRNVVHKLIKPRMETPVKEKPTTIVKVVSPTVIKPIAKPGKVEIYSSSPKAAVQTPKKDDKSPKIVMVSSKLIQGSPKFVKSPQILKISPRNILAAVKTSPSIRTANPIILTPKKPITVLPKVAVKRLTSKIVPIEDDSSRPRRNVPHKFIKTTNNGIEKTPSDKKVAPQEKKVAVPTTPQKLDPVESMHVALLKEFLSDSKSVQMELVKKKATSIARIIGLKSFKASDDWTKKFIAGNLATCNGSSSAN